LDVGWVILGNIVLSKVWSIGEWFIWSVPYFAWRYPIDRSYFHQRLLRRENRDVELSDNSENTTRKISNDNYL
jgi:hypothetical protein